MIHIFFVFFQQYFINLLAQISSLLEFELKYLIYNIFRKSFSSVIFLSILLFFVSIVSCRDIDSPNYSKIKVETSLKDSLNMLKTISEMWKIVEEDKLDYDGIRNLSNNSDDDIYHNILQYDPVSLILTKQKNKQEVSFQLLMFEMNSPLDAWGAYSSLRNPNNPPYLDKLLVNPSEGFYLEGCLVIYRGTRLLLFYHNITELSFIKTMVTTLLKGMPNNEYDHSLINILPKGQIIKRSVKYYKKNWPVSGNFQQCAVALYRPHSSIKIFICNMDYFAESKKSFKKYYQYIQNDLGLGSPKIKNKNFQIQNKNLRVKYFFYNSNNYKLHGIFKFKKFIFGVMGSSSKKFSLALSNEIVGNLSLQK